MTGVGLTYHVLACCNFAIFHRFEYCLCAFGVVLLTIWLALVGFCQRDKRFASDVCVRRTGWNRYSCPQVSIGIQNRPSIGVQKCPLVIHIALDGALEIDFQEFPSDAKRFTWITSFYPKAHR